jgi:hypothetical protein
LANYSWNFSTAWTKKNDRRHLPIQNHPRRCLRFAVVAAVWFLFFNID